MSVFDLSGRHVAVAGGSSGIGLAVARLALDLGARVSLLGRHRPGLERAKLALEAKPAIAAADMGDADAARAAFAELGPIDDLVCTTGGSGDQGDFADGGAEAISAAMGAKLATQAGAVRAALSTLSDRGSIVLTSGAYGRRPSAGASGLVATNLAVEGLARALALELAPRRVNVVSPGLVDTPAHDAMGDEAREAMFEQARRSLPLGRVATPADVAAVYVAVLCCDYMTGSVVDVDGGAGLS